MTSLVWVSISPFLLLTVCLVVELVVGLRPLKADSKPLTEAPRAVIVVPAHDEALLLKTKLSDLKSAAGGQASILLVADNCRDETAEIARSIGVEVIERNDHQRRGKGFALDFARAHLAETPPDLVIIIDADCSSDAISLRKLIERCWITGRPCQASYLQKPALSSSPSVQLSTFAFFVKNVIRQRALQRLSHRVLLVGSGMAFPWRVFLEADLATSSIVEDLKLGQELAEQGFAPMFVENATVWGDAETERNTLSQRRRWEGGFLENAFRVAPIYFLKSLARRDIGSAWFAINLMVPPLALLVLLDLVAVALAGAARIFGAASGWPALSLSATILATCVALSCTWWSGGRKFVEFRTLARIPLYVCWKLPLYLAFSATGAPKEWVRTDRSQP